VVSCDADSVLLVDCLGTLVAGIVAAEALRAGESEAETYSESIESAAESRTQRLVDALIRRSGDTVVVTNEVGDGVVPPFPSGRLFRDLMGRANRSLVEAADASYLAVCGRAIELTELPRDVGWPGTSELESM